MYDQITAIQEQARGATEDGSYVHADSLYSLAGELLGPQPHSLDEQMLRAQILGEHGRTKALLAYAAQGNDTARLLCDARDYITDAAAIVGRFQGEYNLGSIQMTDQELRALHTASGTFHRYLGCVATTALSMECPIGVDAVDQYQWAHEELLQGDNGEQLVVNALAAAHHERLFGTSADEKRWGVRSLHAVAWALRHDRQHFPAVCREFMDYYHGATQTHPTAPQADAA